MIRPILAAALVALTATAATAVEIKDLAGSYKILSMKQDGMDAPKEMLEKVKGVSIEGDKFTIDLGGDKKIATIKIDDSKKPGTLDLSPSDGPEKGKSFPGIFTFEKGKLTIALTEKADRPTDFKGGKDLMVIELEKEKK